MIRRTLKVLEIAAGSHPQKAILLAQKHKNAEFTAVDLENIRRAKVLKKLGMNEQPKNLLIKSKTNALTFLKHANNSYHHVYAHFWGGIARHNDRVALFRSAHKALKKGGRLILIDEGHFGNQLAQELKEAGFTTTIKRLTIKEVLRLDTPTARELAKGLIETESFNKTFEKKMGKDEFINFKHNLARLSFAKAINRLEGNNQDRKTQKAVGKVLHDSSEIFSETPFVRVTAVKR